MVIGGIALVVVGFVINLIIGRRKFYRRNQAGVEEFDSYGKAVGTNVLEGISSKIAGALIVIGIIVFIVGLLQ